MTNYQLALIMGAIFIISDERFIQIVGLIMYTVGGIGLLFLDKGNQS